ncbi:uncharacterized protein LOC144711949 [Wolffia australiana]
MATSSTRRPQLVTTACNPSFISLSLLFISSSLSLSLSTFSHFSKLSISSTEKPLRPAEIALSRKEQMKAAAGKKPSPKGQRLICDLFSLSHSLRKSFLFISFLFFTLYALHLLHLRRLRPISPAAPPLPPPTSLRHIVFGIAASAELWSTRKDYVKLWWRPGRTRGFVWLDEPVEFSDDDTAALPPPKLSGNTSHLPYTHKGGRRAAIRISRIVSETLRLPELPPDARWLVMGDDDTVFFPENLVKVLRKYDHRQPFYIGAPSESHVQNMRFSAAMAYGGGGFAVSRALAAQLEPVQDRCIARYPGLYGSDDRVQACMAELGVPLTREAGFHQFDVYGSLQGLLAAHPVAPVVSLHHLDVVEPVVPGLSRVAALRRLVRGPARLDEAGLLQQSICYVKGEWTVAVAWGYAVQVMRGVMSPREAEMPTRTFLNWYRREDYKGYAFNTRPVARNPCQKPYVFFIAAARVARNGSHGETTVTRYERDPAAPPHPLCRWKVEDPVVVKRVLVFKRADPLLWNRAPRRNCCRARRSTKEEISVEVGICREGEISEPN